MNEGARLCRYRKGRQFPILWCLQLLEQGLGEGMVGELIALSSFDRLLHSR
jgi:hypothetical protein